MYVIIKGRIAVEKKSVEYGNLPRVIATRTDGEHFGELGLIDHNKLAKNSGGQFIEIGHVDKKG